MMPRNPSADDLIPAPKEKKKERDHIVTIFGELEKNNNGEKIEKCRRETTG